MPMHFDAETREIRFTPIGPHMQRHAVGPTWTVATLSPDCDTIWAKDICDIFNADREPKVPTPAERESAAVSQFVRGLQLVPCADEALATIVASWITARYAANGGI